MFKILSVFAAAMVILFAVAGCSAVPVAQVTDEPFFAASKNADLNKVTQKILEVGKRRGFSMKVIAPGHIEAFYAKREVRAVMDVKYTTEHFSITYKDSTNLKYNSASNTIS
ncbi:MAG: hypothetical protein ACYC4Q_02640, partial [Victivallaceae bacterium]